MKRVTGIGGIFFKCEDTAKQKSWYQKHLGMEMNDWGGSIFWWRDADQPEKKCSTSWSTFKNDTTYFEPSKKPYMFNYRVENLEALLKVLKEEGVEQIGEIEVTSQKAIRQLQEKLNRQEAQEKWDPRPERKSVINRTKNEIMKTREDYEREMRKVRNGSTIHFRIELFQAYIGI